MKMQKRNRKKEVGNFVRSSSILLFHSFFVYAVCVFFCLPSFIYYHTNIHGWNWLRPIDSFDFSPQYFSFGNENVSFSRACGIAQTVFISCFNGFTLPCDHCRRISRLDDQIHHILSWTEMCSTFWMSNPGGVYMIFSFYDCAQQQFFYSKWIAEKLKIVIFTWKKNTQNFQSVYGLSTTSFESLYHFRFISFICVTIFHWKLWCVRSLTTNVWREKIKKETLFMQTNIIYAIIFNCSTLNCYFLASWFHYILNSHT